MGKHKKPAEKILVDEYGYPLGKKEKIPAWLRFETRSTHRTKKQGIPKDRADFIPCDIYYDLNLSWENEDDYHRYLDIPFSNPRDFEILYMRYIVHCAEKNIIPDMKAVKYFGLVFSKILAGENAEKALGLRRPGSGAKRFMEMYRKRELCRKIDDLVNKTGCQVKEAIAEVAQDWPSSLEDENPEQTVRDFYFKWDKYGPHRILMTTRDSSRKK